MEAAGRIADAYTRSPVAAKDQQTMEKDDYLRKKMGEMKDHAADGKKGFKISAGEKRDVVIRDLGRSAMEDTDIEMSRLLLAMLDITNDDLLLAANISLSELMAL
jgi:hypothetical protein